MVDILLAAALSLVGLGVAAVLVGWRGWQLISDKENTA